MGKGGRWLGTRTLLPAWGWLHPKQARQEARVPGIQSAPQKSNMGWRHQLLHALSSVWKNKTQTWPQGDALLACIPTTCISTGRDSREMETDTEIRQHNVGLHADSRFGFPQPCFLTENGKKANILLQECGSCRCVECWGEAAGFLLSSQTQNRAKPWQCTASFES